MKNWNTPAMVEVEVSATQYGGTKTVEFDDIYVNAEGNYEGTFKQS